MNRPLLSEFHPFYNGYIQKVPEGDFFQLLNKNSTEVISFFSGIGSELHDFSYEPGKWTIRQIILHMTDTERVMSYRALTVSRGDVETELPGMDEKLFALHADVGDRKVEDLLNEFAAVREATSFLFRNMNDEQCNFKGKVLGHIITPRALGYIIIGHTLHHMDVVRERYLGAESGERER